MDSFGEKPKFEIPPIMEQMPFKNPAVQSFFIEWCEINDSIQPQMISRDEWEKRGIKGVLEKRPDGKQTLFIPKDLQLWEMIGVMEAVDRDTFAAKPELRTEAKEKLLVLAKTFQNAGVYIAQRLEGIVEGREIAKALVQEFYEYGQSLAFSKRSELPLDADGIASQNLMPEEVETVDRFLAGDTLYESRQKRVEKGTTGDPSKKGELYEAARQKTLTQFFRVAEKAFMLKSKGADGELRGSTTQLKPWQSDAPIHSAFLAKIEKAMRQKIETPKREFEMAIFRRGMELLQRNMPFDELPHWVKSNYLHWQNGEKTLREALRIDQLRVELDGVRKTGDAVQTAVKERGIADKIQNVVSSFPYKFDANNPAEMVANQYINCVGASMLGGALMKEAGLNYLVGDVPEHSILFLVTSDGQVEWRDMLNASFNEKLTDEIIEGHRKNGAPLTTRDIVIFSQKPTREGIMFDIKSDRYKEKLSWVSEGQRKYLTVFEPEHGQQIQVLNNSGGALSNLGRYEEALQAYRQAVAVDPKYAYPYNGLGNTFYRLGRYEEALQAYRRAVAVNPRYANSYNGLGSALYCLGRNKEAIEAFRKFIDLADKKKDDYFIKQAEEVIAHLKK